MTDQEPNSQTEIESVAQYEAALRLLSQESRPPAILRLLMQGLEKYRQSRRMGWSRKQNKVGVQTYLTFKMGERIHSFLPHVEEVIDSNFSALPDGRRAFIADLLGDRKLMGFLFFQETQELDATGETLEYETVCVSLGRVVAGKSRFRDRVDLMLDAPIVNQHVQGLSRVKLFIDPFEEHQPSSLEAAPLAGAGRLLDRLSALHAQHREDDVFIWDHWTQGYIDYFAARTRPLQGTRFPTALDEAYQNMVSDPSARRGAA